MRLFSIDWNFWQRLSRRRIRAASRDEGQGQLIEFNVENSEISHLFSEHHVGPATETLPGFIDTLLSEQRINLNATRRGRQHNRLLPNSSHFQHGEHADGHPTDIQFPPTISQFWARWFFMMVVVKSFACCQQGNRPDVGRFVVVVSVTIRVASPVDGCTQNNIGTKMQNGCD
jgi:hypothetical protein